MSKNRAKTRQTTTLRAPRMESSRRACASRMPSGDSDNFSESNLKRRPPRPGRAGAVSVADVRGLRSTYRAELPGRCEPPGSWSLLRAYRPVVHLAVRRRRGDGALELVAEVALVVAAVDALVRALVEEGGDAVVVVLALVTLVVVVVVQPAMRAQCAREPARRRVRTCLGRAVIGGLSFIREIECRPRVVSHATTRHGTTAAAAASDAPRPRARTSPATATRQRGGGTGTASVDTSKHERARAPRFWAAAGAVHHVAHRGPRSAARRGRRGRPAPTAPAYTRS